jgi:putative N6-adenine-specific DNA methylase
MRKPARKRIGEEANFQEREDLRTKLIAKTMFGLESVLAQELRDIGATGIQEINRAVLFDFSPEILYKANLHLRTALKILQPIKEFNAYSPEELYDACLKMKWEAFLSLKKTFAVDFTVKSPFFTHTQYAALKVKDAICDRFRSQRGNRPDVNTENPDILINLHIKDSRVTISLDTTGQSLHKRGNRASQNDAPINEVLAAGLILLSGWDAKSNFVDAMCGSGTILLEAASIATKTPPNLKRERFCFMNYENFDQDLFHKVKMEAQEQIVSPQCSISGSDIEAKAVNITLKNMRAAGFMPYISVQQLNIRDVEPPEGGGVLIINPPYGERITPEDINALYKECGDAFKKNFQGYSCWIFSSNEAAFKHVGLKPTRNITLFNGSLECKFRKYEIYAGSKKDAYKTKTPLD